MIQLGKYSKFFTAVAGLVITVASTKYGGTTWFPYVIALASAAGVYGVPNSPAMLEVKGEVVQTPQPPVLITPTTAVPKTTIPGQS